VSYIKQVRIVGEIQLSERASDFSINESVWIKTAKQQCTSLIFTPYYSSLYYINHRQIIDDVGQAAARSDQKINLQLLRLHQRKWRTLIADILILVHCKTI